MCSGALVAVETWWFCKSCSLDESSARLSVRLHSFVLCFLSHPPKRSQFAPTRLVRFHWTSQGPHTMIPCTIPAHCLLGSSHRFSLLINTYGYPSVRRCYLFLRSCLACQIVDQNLRCLFPLSHICIRPWQKSSRVE
jgi:hypothetical protein